MVPPPQIDTPRLRLLAPEPALADTVAEFYRRNKDHFARWDPPHPPGFLTAAFHQAKLEAGAAAFRAGRDWRYWLTLRGDPETAPRVIGQCHVSSVVRGTFHSANLGYALDHAHQGSGLMFEAVSTLIDEAMFAPGVNLHRLQAGHLPQNQRSGRLLQRLGFTQIGIAHDYLFIDGAWRDHLLWQRINPGCVRPAGCWLERQLPSRKPMSIQLNHTIVPARDAAASAAFLADILGLDAPTRFGPFHGVETANGVTLDFMQANDGEYEVHHYAFIVSEAEFDAIFGRIVERGLEYAADPGMRQRGEINHHDGGRGVYWDDPNGHRLEIITRPYGGGG
jgi:[ribosomal protein S5]-alanine N-acetyltransferase